MEVLRQFQGRLLVSDEAPRVVEGTWRGDKIAVLSVAVRGIERPRAS